MIRPWIVVIGIICSATAYAAVPVTKRAQHMVFQLKAVQTIAAKAYHKELSQLSSKHELDNSSKVLKKVRRLSSHLIAQAIRLKPKAKSWPWEVHITSDPNITAYSMSGGKILVSTHFIKHYHLTDQELSVVLAHEIGHVIAEHVREQVSSVALFKTTVPASARRLSNVIEDMQSDISVYLMLEPLSRLQEMEADDIGIELSARAGIPPSAVVSFYAKLAQGDSGQSLFNTHGPAIERVKFADSMAEYAQAVYEASQHARMLPNYVFTDTRQRLLHR